MSSTTVNDELLKIIRDSSSATSCSCSFCKPNQGRKASHKCEDRDDVVDNRNGDIQQQNKRHSRDYSRAKTIEIQKTSADGSVSLRFDKVCLGLLIDFFRPLQVSTTQKQHNRDLNMNEDRGDTSRQIPSIVICKGSIDINCIEGRSSSITSNSMKLRILQKADDLQAMLEKDLKTRTTTETTSCSLENSNIDPNYSSSSSDDSSIDKEMIKSNRECVISSSVSSISCPSFPDSVSACSKDYAHAYHELGVLDLKEGDHNQTHDEQSRGEISNIQLQLSGDRFQDCHDDIDYLSVDRSIISLQDFKKHSGDFFDLKGLKDSFLSYEDALSKNLTLDIADGISYDDEKTEVSHALSFPFDALDKRLDNSYDDRANLDNLCQQSEQSVRSIKSYYDDII